MYAEQIDAGAKTAVDAMFMWKSLRKPRSPFTGLEADLTKPREEQDELWKTVET